MQGKRTVNETMQKMQIRKLSVVQCGSAKIKEFAMNEVE
jgi:hypothetical protein